MLVLKGSEAAARIKKEVQEMVEGLGGHVPTAAIVRVGERPDDLSYERNVMKKIASFGMEARSFAFPEFIREGEFQAEFQKINDDPSIDGILLFCPLPRHMNGRTFEELIRPEAFGPNRQVVPAVVFGRQPASRFFRLMLRAVT